MIYKIEIKRIRNLKRRGFLSKIYLFQDKWFFSRFLNLFLRLLYLLKLCTNTHIEWIKFWNQSILRQTINIIGAKSNYMKTLETILFGISFVGDTSDICRILTRQNLFPGFLLLSTIFAVTGSLYQHCRVLSIILV